MNKLVYQEAYEPHSYYTSLEESFLGDAIVLLIPALTFVEFRLVGRLFLPEIILIGLLPFLLFFKGSMLRTPLPGKLLFLGCLWLLAQIITDLIRGTPFRDYTRGWSKITFFLAHFVALYMLLYGNRKRLILFALGLVLSSFISYKFKIDSHFSYARAYPWKFGIGSSVTFLVVLFSTTNIVSRTRMLPSLIMILLSIFNVYMGFRSLGGICFLTGVYILTQQHRSARLNKTIKPSLAKVASIALFAVVITIGFINAYAYTADQGWLGKRAKALVQSQSGKFGVLIGGRKEIYCASRAIIDSPIIGHGSWAKIDHYINYLRNLEQYSYVIRNLNELKRSTLIPTHSHFFGGWFEAGILAAVFWGWVLILTAKTLIRQYNFWDPLTPLITYIGVRFIWDIIFSPFGAERRLTTAFILVFLMSELGKLKAHKQYTVEDNTFDLSR